MSYVSIWVVAVFFTGLDSLVICGSRVDREIFA
jgi:hypothetical protein